ncbi:hypothetical protein NDU88_012206 [Pleurodeles waltl]|uniref:Uncharacterized protein n=1 Tax=Pleurodeles waltl TaxID=8319 RepID=A0AAV7R597_PLEWA|nr:hypothetical protein NDU88_012206 [Pleurodeles waltl]
MGLLRLRWLWGSASSPSIDITLPGHLTAVRRIGAAFWHLGATPHHIELREEGGSQLVFTYTVNCHTPSHRLTTVKDSSQDLTEAVGDTPTILRSKLETFRPPVLRAVEATREALVARH